LQCQFAFVVGSGSEVVTLPDSICGLRSQELNVGCAGGDINWNVKNKIMGVDRWASDEGKAQLPKPRVFEMNYGAKVRGRIIIQTLYDFLALFRIVFFPHKRGLTSSDSLFQGARKIIQFLYDD